MGVIWNRLTLLVIRGMPDLN